jgi:glycosyltransferase involved in cell wall biosynthesis
VTGRATSSPLVGFIGRFHPDKDFRGFVRAAAILRRSIPQVGFVLCGTGAERSNPDLTNWISEAGISSAVHLLGPRTDVARVIAGLDLLVSTSVSEAFPNVVGEAMASGVPCVVTDVGDSALIVGNTGRIVEPSCPEEIAGACQQLLGESTDDRLRRSTAARQRIASAFDIERTSLRHYELWEELVGLPHRSFESAPYTTAAA